MSHLATTRTARVAAGFGLLPLVLFGCFPFLGNKTEPPHVPALVQRLVDETSALGIPPSPPPLPQVTRTLARAVAALPRSPPAYGLAPQIDAAAGALEKSPDLAPAQRSLTLALQAIDAMKKPAGSDKDRQRVVGEARSAVDALSSPPANGDARAAIENAYRSVAHAMLIVTGGDLAVASGHALPELVGRLAVEDPDQARRSGAQAVYAIAAALEELPARPPKVTGFAAELRKHAARLADAAELDYPTQLKEALAIAVDALHAIEKAQRNAALDLLETQARTAVDRIAKDRPFALQRAAAQDALRLIADALTVAASR